MDVDDYSEAFNPMNSSFDFNSTSISEDLNNIKHINEPSDNYDYSELGQEFDLIDSTFDFDSNRSTSDRVKRMKYSLPTENYSHPDHRFVLEQSEVPKNVNFLVFKLMNYLSIKTFFFRK